MGTLSTVSLRLTEPHWVRWVSEGRQKGDQILPKYLALGTLRQEGYENMESGPETVEQFIEQINGMGGSFDPEDFFILNGEYQHAGIVEFPSREAAKQVADTYARSGRGRLQLEPIIATGPDGYEDYVSNLVE